MNGTRPRPKECIRVVAAMIGRADGRYLITQRRKSAVLPLLWEFPGGRVEPNESDEQALRREVEHRLGVSLEVGALVSYVRHTYESYDLDLYLYDCQLGTGRPNPVRVNALAWVASTEFESYDFTPADERSVSKLLGLAVQ